MRELGYVYNRSAANLRTSRSRLVGMVISDLMNPFFAELAVGIENAFQKAGYVPILANTSEDPERQHRVLKVMREHGVGGIVISPARSTDPISLGTPGDRIMPMVTTMRRLDDDSLPYVGPDNRAGARAATAHLIAHGHRRIAFVGGLAHMATQRERLAGWRDALVAVGLDPDAQRLIETLPTRAAGSEVVGAFLAGPDAPTAALCYNDIVAIGLIGALAQRGLEVGRRFGVIGFDDIAEARYCAPALSTVSADTQHLGGMAAQVLLDLIDGVETPANLIGDTRLIVRQSCGGPLTDASSLTAARAFA
jgi:LacI family transcriptional regulator